MGSVRSPSRLTWPKASNERRTFMLAEGTNQQEPASWPCKLFPVV